MEGLGLAGAGQPQHGLCQGVQLHLEALGAKIITDPGKSAPACFTKMFANTQLFI